MKNRTLFLGACLMTASMYAPARTEQKQESYNPRKPKGLKNAFWDQQRLEREVEKLREKAARESEISHKKHSWWKTVLAVVIAVVVTFVVTAIVVASLVVPTLNF